MFDENDWNVLIERYYASVLGAGRRYAPSPQAAADIAQQVFLEFYAKQSVFFADTPDGEKLADNPDIGPLLLGMTRKIALRHWRELKKNSSENIRRLAERLQQRREERFQAGEEGVREEKIETLQSCLKTLSRKSRQLIEAHYMDGESVRDIARRTESTENAVYKAIARIRRKLRLCVHSKTKETR